MNEIKHKATTSSYGLRLLRTVTGKRENLQASAAKLDVSHLIKIDPNFLCFTNSKVLGAGNFGECKTATFHQYTVCVKEIKDSNELFLREAFFLNKIGCHKNVPYLFGVVIPHKSLVMSCHLIEIESVTIYDALHTPKHWIESHKWIHYMVIAIQTISFLHQHNILHYDIKGDNFVFTLTAANEVEPILIDFGKACYAGKGKSYNLNDEEKKIYQEKHSHVAPDLRDGLTNQSKASDVYAWGQLLYYVYKKLSLNKTIKVTIKLCLMYHDYERPSCTDVEKMLLLL